MNFPKTKTFEGERYKFYSCTHVYGNYETMALEHLKKGLKVRSFKIGGLWGVYIRDPSKTARRSQ